MGPLSSSFRKKCGTLKSTVLDLPRHMLIQYPHLVHDAHVAVVVAELTLAATRDTIRVWHGSSRMLRRRR